jgi:lipoprotein NlpI
MRRWGWAFALALILVAASFLPASPAWADAPPADSSDSADADLQRCKEASTGPDPAAVVALCSRVLSQGHPSDAIAALVYLNRGTAYLSQQDFSSAITDFTKALELRPGTADLYGLRGRAHMGQGDTFAAVGDFAQAIQIEPDRAEFYDLRGDASAAAGEDPAALADYVHAMRMHRCPADMLDLDTAGQGRADVCQHLRTGIALYVEGSDAAAIQEFEQARTSWGTPRDQGIALLWLALAQQRSRQDQTTSLNNATAAMEFMQWPGPLILSYLGRFPTKDLPRASLDPEPATSLQQGCDVDFYVAARALVDGRAQAAAQGFGAALKVCSSDSLEFAAAKAEQISTRRPVSAQMAQQMSACAAVNDAGTDPQSIVELCDDALNNADLPDPWQFNALIMTASARHRLGDDTNAAADIDRAIALRPGSPDAFRRRGLYRLALGDADGGLADLGHAIALNPELLEARLNRGWALADRGDWKGATADFTHAVAIDPHNPRVYLARGVVAFLAGEDGHAMQNFDIAIDVAPDGAPYAAIWLALVARHGHVDDERLAAGTTATDAEQWPGPILRFLKGEISAGDLALAAGDPSSAQGCEAAFYPGLAAMIDGHLDEAKTDLVDAQTFCSDASIESAAAAILLRKM